MSLSYDIAAVHSNGVDIYKFPQQDSKSLGEPTVRQIAMSSVKIFKFSHSGNIFCVCANLETCLYDAQSLRLLQVIKNKSAVSECFFSPSDSFLCINETFNSSQNTTNFSIWSLPSSWEESTVAKLKFSFACKPSNSRGLISFSFDDLVFSRLECGKVLFFDTASFVPLSGVNSQNLSNVSSHVLMGDLQGMTSTKSNGNVAVGCFFKESKGKPALFKIFKLTDLSKPLCQRSCLNCDSVEYFFGSNVDEHGKLLNRSNVKLLLNTVSNHDASGKSYYGHSSLYFFSVAISSSHCLFDGRVDFDKEGPVHNSAWNPNGNEFIVLYGFMPSRAAIYSSKNKLLHSFGEISRNTAKYNQNGSLLYIAGFGNLSGYIDIWHMAENKKLCTFQEAGTSVCEWLPDGCHLLTAILSPRLRVDNGFKIFNVMGQEVFCKKYTELIFAVPRPQTSKISLLSYEDCKARSSPLLMNQPIKKVSAYVPPSLRKSNNSTPITSSPISTPSLTSSISNQTTTSNQTDLTANEKQMQNLSRKLQEITILKQKQSNGASLLTSQLQKLAKEEEYLSQLYELRKASKS